MDGQERHDQSTRDWKHKLWGGACTCGWRGHRRTGSRHLPTALNTPPSGPIKASALDKGCTVHLGMPAHAMGRRSTPSVGGTLLLLWVAGLAAISPSAQAARALSGRSMLVRQACRARSRDEHTLAVLRRGGRREGRQGGPCICSQRRPASQPIVWPCEPNLAQPFNKHVYCCVQVTTGRTLHAASVDSGSGGSGGAQQCDSAAMLDALNALRAEHGAPPLSWSDDLAQQAVDVARQQADNPSCQFQVRRQQVGPAGGGAAAGGRMSGGASFADVCGSPVG